MPARKARILIVDDSRCFRSALEQALAGYEDVTVVGSVFNGTRVLEYIRTHPLDLVTLDVEMPGPDGLQTLRGIQHYNASHPEGPPVGVIMVSAYTSAGTEPTLQALQHGAFDFVTKPSGPSPEANIQQLGQQLITKIRHYLQGPRPPRKTMLAPAVALPAPSPGGENRVKGPSRHGQVVRAILIAVSTGGPWALAALLPDLCRRTELPILIVQHMPEGCLSSLVSQLSAKCSHAVVEARDGEPILARTVYFAPVGKHLVLRQPTGGPPLATLSDQPAENGFRPSADVLFRSAALVYGGECLALVLTGQLNDGTAGLGPLKRAGAYAIAQDKDSSVVWGMPGSAVASGQVDEVLPLDQIAAAVQTVVEQGRRP